MYIYIYIYIHIFIYIYTKTTNIITSISTICVYTCIEFSVKIGQLQAKVAYRNVMAAHQTLSLSVIMLIRFLQHAYHCYHLYFITFHIRWSIISSIVHIVLAQKHKVASSADHGTR